MTELLAMTKALSDASRLRAVLFLKEGELCACQIAAGLALAPSTVSRHMQELERAGLVSSRKEGRWVHYRRVDRAARPAARAALKWIDAHSAASEQSRRDDVRLREIRRAGPEALCGRGGQGARHA